MIKFLSTNEDTNFYYYYLLLLFLKKILKELNRKIVIIHN